MAKRNDTLDRVLTEFPPLIKHFADTRDLFADAVKALGRISVAAETRWDRPATTCTPTFRTFSGRSSSSGRASPYLIGALKLMLTLPFSIENVPKVVRGDYLNTSLDD